MALVAKKPSLKRTTSSRDLTRTFKKPRQLPLVLTKTPELKNSDWSGNPQLTQSDGTVGYYMRCFNSIVLGDTATAREGRSIRCKSIRIKGWVQSYQLATQVSKNVRPTMVRLMLFIDKYPNSTSFNPDTLLQTITSDYTLAYKNLNNESRFHVLRDILIPVNGGSYGTTSGYSGTPIAVPFEFYHEFKDLMVTTITNDSGTGDTTNVAKNAICFYAVSTDPVTVQSTLLTYQSRFRFYDF